jgi:hypothetical protein
MTRAPSTEEPCAAKVASTVLKASEGGDPFAEPNRALKMILRLRKNSLFYANEHGAYVGDVITSLIETCRLAGVNPLDYLSALMHNRSAVFRDPGAWLPWNYRDHRERGPETGSLRHPPPVLGQLEPLGITVPQ